MLDASPQVTAAFLAVAGTLLAATISQLISYLVARSNQTAQRQVADRTLEAQRILARDQARREWDRQMVEAVLVPLRQRADQIVALHQALTSYSQSHSAVRRKKWEQRASEIQERLSDVNEHGLIFDASSIPDEAFVSAFRSCLEAVNEAWELLDDPDVTESFEAFEYRQRIISRLSRELAAVHAAGRDYIYR